MPPSNSASPASAPLALTMGEPAGIGGEIALKAWARREAAGLPPFFLLDNPARLAALAQRLGLAVPVREIAAPAETAACFAAALPVLPVAMAKAPEPGRPEPAATAAAIKAIEQATRLALSGEAAAIVTNPIAKAAAHAAGFRFPGHTEFIAALCKSEEPVMMLASPHLRVALVSIHVSLRDAIAGLDEERIVRVAEIAAAALQRDFGIARPRLAVAGLNPHAGEHGAMGHEDSETVAPAVARLRAEGIDARGPLPPDTMFHAAARATYDAAICMYHDQGLIPLKTLDFEQGVNITLGLPIIRTSPDHGTAFDIAGTGRADPQSLIAALRLAEQMARHRAAFDARR